MTDRPKDKTPNRYIGRRALILGTAQTAIIGALGWRMHHLQVKEADRYRLAAEDNRINISYIPPARGLIYDRRGMLLADNRQNYRILMDEDDPEQRAMLLDRLAKLIPISDEDRARILEGDERGKELLIAEHLSWEQFAPVVVNAPALPGIKPDVGLSRFYPHRDAFCHVVGYVGRVSDYDLSKIEDPEPILYAPNFQIGKSGVETRAEDTLRGTAGILQIEANNWGHVVRELDRTEAISGADLHLTLSERLQKYALRRLGTESAAAVAMDVTNGDVLALASAPTFDPNNFVFGISSTDYRALLENDHRPLHHKAVSGTYPPGSTFKMVTALAALEAGVIGPNDTVFCNGVYQYRNAKFHCWNRGGHGHVSLERSLQQSCDIYYYEVAQRVGIDKISEMANRLGLGVIHDIPVPAVREGLMPTKAWKQETRNEGWVPGDTINASIGQGFTLASPLQLAVMTARIATGTSVAPRLIRAVGGVQQPAPEPVDLGIHPTFLNLIRNGMYRVVNDPAGTAYRSRLTDSVAAMAGKTGTSQVRRITAAERARGVIRNEDLPWERRDHALFVCYAPVENPRYAISVIVEHGGGGSAVAAPIARDIMWELLRIAPPGETDAAPLASGEAQGDRA
ncbi:penicillin-binding protein 2 [Paracoccaceae bacterium GXU_MW_L88]